MTSQPVLGQAEVLGDQLPGVGDRRLLEVVAEAEIAQHLEEGVVARGVADVVQVVVLAAGADAFLRRGGAHVGALLLAGEHVLELHHAGVGEHQRRVVARHQRRAFDHLVPVAGKVVEEGGADVVAAGHGGLGSVADRPMGQEVAQPCCPCHPGAVLPDSAIAGDGQLQQLPYRQFCQPLRAMDDDQRIGTMVEEHLAAGAAGRHDGEHSIGLIGLRVTHGHNRFDLAVALQQRAAKRDSFGADRQPPDRGAEMSPVQIRASCISIAARNGMPERAVVPRQNIMRRSDQGVVGRGQVRLGQN